MAVSVSKSYEEANVWEGGDQKPLKAGYGKLMMWFFIVSDSLTFSGFLVSGFLLAGLLLSGFLLAGFLLAGFLLAGFLWN